MNSLFENTPSSPDPKRDSGGELERKKAMYANVLTFPEGTEHLNYFDKIPHPYRIPDKELAIWEAVGRRDLNTSLLEKRMAFERVKKFLSANLSYMDKKLLALPDAMQDLIDRTKKEDERQALTHLRDAFLIFFSTPLNPGVTPDIQWIDYEFATNYLPAQIALKSLRANLFNDKGINKLVEKLQEAGAFGDEKRNFYFWNTDPHNWPEISFQSRAADFANWDFASEVKQHYGLPPQYKALGAYTINAIPEGYVQPKGNGLYEVGVDKIYLFANDSFNFEGFEALGYWPLEPCHIEDPTIYPNTPSLLYNSNFRDFQRHGYGRYFPVLSKLHEIRDFEPIRLEYYHGK